MEKRREGSLRNIIKYWKGKTRQSKKNKKIMEDRSNNQNLKWKKGIKEKVRKGDLNDKQGGWEYERKM